MTHPEADSSDSHGTAEDLNLRRWKAEVRTFCSNIREELHELKSSFATGSPRPTPERAAAPSPIEQPQPVDESPKPKERPTDDSEMVDVPDRLESLKRRLAERINVDTPASAGKEEQP